MHLKRDTRLENEIREALERMLTENKIPLNPKARFRDPLWDGWPKLAGYCLERGEIEGMEPFDVAGVCAEAWLESPKAKAAAHHVGFLTTNPGEFWELARKRLGKS